MTATALIRRCLIPAIILTTTACADLPTEVPADGPILAAAYSARPAERCVNVQGRIEGNVFTSSVVSGDLQGVTAAYQAPIVELSGQAIHLQTFHRFFLADGTFDTVDRGVQAPVEPPVYRLNNRYTVVGGTGAWEGASGFLHVHGSLVIDFTFQDPRNGSINVSYEGRVCRA